MARLGIKTEVHLRSDMGRFIAACDAAATRTVEDAVREGAKDAQRLAPSGPPRKDYRRRPKLRPSISGRMLSSRSGEIVATAVHAGPQEFGNPEGGPKRGRHYMLRARQLAQRSLKSAASRNYPG